MHDVVLKELEDHLAGRASSAFHEHLSDCPACRQEVESIAEVSQELRCLREQAETAPSPSAYFYARLSANIVDQEKKSTWSLFSPGAAFFRRVAFASLLVLAGLGSYLVTREGEFAGTDAAAIMAQHDSTATHAESSDRDLMLVTLASYSDSSQPSGGK
jgi:predicted anti-sigma-YlaC factor YlaD